VKIDRERDWPQKNAKSTKKNEKFTGIFCVLCVLSQLNSAPVHKETVILASGSPRRRELLAEMGVAFEVVTSDVPELDAISSPGMPPVGLAQENARRKALAVAALHSDRWVLGADTVVTLDNCSLGKPISLDEARLFLEKLGGREHEVVTACALIEPTGKRHEFYDATKVTFRKLSPEIIESYLAKVHVLDKAGAYALQEQGEMIIERVEGSRTNVVGLPTELLAKYFQAAGLL